MEAGPLQACFSLPLNRYQVKSLYFSVLSRVNRPDTNQAHFAADGWLCAQPGSEIYHQVLAFGWLEHTCFQASPTGECREGNTIPEKFRFSASHPAAEHWALASLQCFTCSRCLPHLVMCPPNQARLPTLNHENVHAPQGCTPLRGTAEPAFPQSSAHFSRIRV